MLAAGCGGDEAGGVDDGEVGAILVLNLHHNILRPEAWDLRLRLSDQGSGVRV